MNLWKIKSQPSDAGCLKMEGHLIGISEDEGKHWVFLDAHSYRNPQMAKLFPELADKLDIPASKKPQFVPDDKAEGKAAK